MPLWATMITQNIHVTSMKFMMGLESAHNPKLTIDSVSKGPLIDNGALGSA
jgi:hypothetical protein